MKLFLLKPEDLSRFDCLYDRTLSEQAEPDMVALGAVDDQAQPPRAAGLLLARVVGTELLVEWLYVASACRRQGVATALLDRLIQTASHELDIEGVTVLVSQGQEDLLGFLEDFGFGILFAESRGEFRARLGDLSPVPQRQAKGYAVVPLQKVPRVYWSAFYDGLGNASCGVPLPVRAEDYATWSMACCADGKLVAVFLVQYRDGQIEFPWIYTAPKWAKLAMPLLFNAVVQGLHRDLPPDTPLVIGTLGRPGEALAERLLPHAQWTELYTARWIF